MLRSHDALGCKLHSSVLIEMLVVLLELFFLNLISAMRDFRWVYFTSPLAIVYSLHETNACRNRSVVVYCCCLQLSLKWMRWKEYSLKFTLTPLVSLRDVLRMLIIRTGLCITRVSCCVWNTVRLMCGDLIGRRFNRIWYLNMVALEEYLRTVVL